MNKFLRLVKILFLCNIPLLVIYQFDSGLIPSDLGWNNVHLYIDDIYEVFYYIGYIAMISVFIMCVIATFKNRKYIVITIIQLLFLSLAFFGIVHHYLFPSGWLHIV